MPAKSETNRTNARKSTGPRTVAGKSRSAQNARTHGLSRIFSDIPSNTAGNSLQEAPGSTSTLARRRYDLAKDAAIEAVIGLIQGPEEREERVFGLKAIERYRSRAFKAWIREISRKTD